MTFAILRRQRLPLWLTLVAGLLMLPQGWASAGHPTHQPASSARSAAPARRARAAPGSRRHGRRRRARRPPPRRTKPRCQPRSKRERAALLTMDVYRVAMIRRDWQALTKLAHPKYKETGGTASTADDYGYAELIRVLKKRFQVVKRIKLHLLCRRLVRLSGGRLAVDFMQSAAFELKLPGGKTRWFRKKDHVRFVLGRHRGAWRFLSGM